MTALFFAAIAAALLSSWLVADQWVAAGLLGLWLVRAYRTQNRVILMTTLSVTGLMMGWFGWQGQRFQHAQAQMPTMVTTRMVVAPDDVRVRGDQLQLLGTVAGKGRVIAYGRIARPADQHQLQTVTTTTEWRVQGMLGPVAPPTNPGQFDAPKYYRGQGVLYQLQLADHYQWAPLKVTGWQWPAAQLHRYRKQFALACERLPPTLRRYALSLLIGMRPADFQTEMAPVRELGLLHLFSLSGMHVILLISMLRWGLIRLHLSEQATTNWLLGLLPAYLILGGGAASLQRAVLTAGLPLVWQRLSHQRHSALSGWSAALLIGLITDPGVLGQLGGQLSYGLALLLLLVPHRSPWQLALNVQLVSLPLLLIATAQWHVLSLFINVLIAPLFGAIIFPATIGGTVFGLINPAVTPPIEWLLSHFQAGLVAVGQLPGLLTVGQPNAVWGWGLGLLTLWTLRRPSWRRYQSLLLAYFALAITLHYPLRGAVHFIDVGQGDSILIRRPFNRQVSLIDTGGQLKFPQPAWKQTDQYRRPRVESITVNYLHRLGITQLDRVYLTHKDVDHMGDFGALLRLMRVKQVVVPAGMAHLPKFQRLLNVVRRPPQVVEALAGQRFADGLTVRHPFKPGAAENADSLAVSGQFGRRTFMFTGDLDRPGERAIMKQFPDLRVSVLKLGHHGSRTASDPGVLQQLGVQIGILSVGRHNRYGHPNASTLETLRQQQIWTYSTAQQGMITYWYGGGRPERWQTFLKEGNLYQRSAGLENHSRG